MLAKFVDGTNIGMFQRRSRARFPFESPQRRGILDGFFRQKLERYSATQLDILRAVH